MLQLEIQVYAGRFVSAIVFCGFVFVYVFDIRCSYCCADGSDKIQLTHFIVVYLIQIENRNQFMLQIFIKQSKYFDVSNQTEHIVRNSTRM